MKATLTGKKITVGVTGGIAAYKAADLVSWLHQQGACVRVVMTEAATHLIPALTMKVLSGNPVVTDIMSEDAAYHVPHIDLADCDLFVVVPATANLLAKAAHGLADDALSAALLATTAPVLAAPAMNANMYDHPATQQNMAVLQSRGWTLVAPGYGRLACGVEGKGRLADATVLREAVLAMFAPKGSLVGTRVLVTAGPTYEYIDPVRFIGNRSSGKMGYALAEAARDAGAEVTLVLGPCHLPDLPGAQTVRIISAQEMYDAVWEHYPTQDIVIMAAAVADYRPQTVAGQKMKKQDTFMLEMEKNPDILKSLGAQKGGHFLVGFAAETNDLTAYATRKLQEKNLDLIVANNVAQPGAGFDGDTNIVTVLSPNQDGVTQEEWPMMTKKEAARRLIDHIVDLRTNHA